jgi:hypothetical protein
MTELGCMRGFGGGGDPAFVEPDFAGERFDAGRRVVDHDALPEVKK